MRDPLRIPPRHAVALVLATLIGGLVLHGTWPPAAITLLLLPLALLCD